MKKIVQFVLTMLLASCGNQTSNIEVKDSIHPKKAGYLQWWSPYFVKALELFN